MVKTTKCSKWSPWRAREFSVSLESESGRCAQNQNRQLLTLRPSCALEGQLAEVGGGRVNSNKRNNEQWEALGWLEHENCLWWSGVGCISFATLHERPPLQVVESSNWCRTSGPTGPTWPVWRETVRKTPVWPSERESRGATLAPTSRAHHHHLALTTGRTAQAPEQAVALDLSPHRRTSPHMLGLLILASLPSSLREASRLSAAHGGCCEGSPKAQSHSD